MELFVQNGVFLKSAPACYLTYINTTGTLFITEYLNSNRRRCIEWKPNDITADSDAQVCQNNCFINKTKTTIFRIKNGMLLTL